MSEARCSPFRAARGRSRLPIAAVTALVCVTSFIGACASARAKPAASPDDPLRALLELSESAAWRELGERALRERGRAPEADDSIPLAPGVALGEGEAERPPPEGIDMPLEAALEAVLAQDVLPPAPEPLQSKGNGTQALRDYARGRSALLAEDTNDAVFWLERAVDADPTAPEPWRALGQAKLSQGREGPGLRDLRRAVAAGLDDPRTHELLGRNAIDGNRNEEAAWFLARALELEPGRADPALPHIIRFELAWALAELGYHRAALEVAQDWRRTAPPPGIPTSFTEHLNSLARLESRLWRRLGDAALRRGDAAGAIDAYSWAAEEISELEGAFAARLVSAALRAARPAYGAMVALRPLMEPGPRASVTQLELIGYAASHSGLGELMARALEEESVERPSTATLEGRTARARAACVPGDRAGVLLEHVARHPFDAPVIRDLLEGAADDADEALGLATRALDADGLNSGVVAEQLCSIGLGRESLVAAARKARRSAGAALLLARCELLFKRPVAAAEALRGAKGDSLGLEVARAEVGMATGEWSAVSQAIEAIRASNSPRRELALGEALRAAQRFDEAGEALAAYARAHPEDPEAARRAAEVLLSRGSLEAGERWLDAAMELDRFDERSLELQLSLGMPGGALEDEERFEAGVRDLREMPGRGPLIRWLSAQQLLQQGLAAEAEERLLAFAADYPTDERVVEMLVQAWRRQAQVGGSAVLERGQAWLRARARERPASVAVPLALGRLIVESGRLSRAEAALTEAYERLPAREIGVAREDLVRELLEEPDRADELARMRLAGAPPTIWTLLDRGRFHARRGEPGEAVAALEALPQEIRLREEQGRVLLATIDDLTTEVEGAGVERAWRAWRAMAIASRYGLTVPPEVHERLLTQMASAGEASTEEYLRAITTTEGQHPGLGTAAILRVATVLAQNGAADEAAAVLTAWARRGDRPEIDERLAEIWFIIVSDGGGVGDARTMLDSIENGMARDLLTRFDGAAALGATSARAELAYLLAGLAYRESRQEVANGLYRLVLEYDPTHPGANNDLAYFITEAGGDLDEAERMLEIAVQAEPNNMNFLDSLGWLRYKLGVLEDKPGAAGDPLRLGAVSLLRRAIRVGAGVENPTILDHYGDALWRTGAREAAIRMWERAHGSLVRTLGGGRAAEVAPALLEEMRARRDSLSEKLEATKQGLEPEVAPLAREREEPSPTDNN